MRAYKNEMPRDAAGAGRASGCDLFLPYQMAEIRNALQRHFRESGNLIIIFVKHENEIPDQV